MNHVLLLTALIVPLSLDTFVIGAALGIAGLPREQRLRMSLILTAFEGGMPIVGFVAGSAMGHVLGHAAGWAAIVTLAFAGMLILRPGSEEAEANRLQLLARAQGIAIISLGLAISVDELAVGFSLGFLGVPPVLAVVWVAAQAFVAAQAGMRLGAGIGHELRERGEQLSGAVLLGLALLLAGLKIFGGGV